MADGPHPAGRLAPGAFAASLGAALAAWMWQTVWEGMGHHVEWWLAVLPASAAAGAAFWMDAGSTARFGQGIIAACEQAPLLRAVVRRLGLRFGTAVQAAAEACLVAAAPSLLDYPPVHHLVVSFLVFLSLAHYYGWRRNSRSWEEAYAGNQGGAGRRVS